LAFWSVLGTERALDRAQENAAETAREGVERRHQICLSAEREHLNDVIGLRRTYSYLESLTPTEREQTLNRFIIRGLAQAEDKVNVDPAPAFCDEPGVQAERRGEPPVGLPEPDPVIPKRPPGLAG